jgi:hypothetical protein
MTTRTYTSDATADKIAGTRCEGCGLSKIAGHRFCEDCESTLSGSLASYERALLVIRDARSLRSAQNARQAKQGGKR